MTTMGSPTPEEHPAATPELVIKNADLGLSAAFTALVGADAWLSEWPSGSAPTDEQEHQRERIRDEIRIARRAIERARERVVHVYMRDTQPSGDIDG